MAKRAARSDGWIRVQHGVGTVLCITALSGTAVAQSAAAPPAGDATRSSSSEPAALAPLEAPPLAEAPALPTAGDAPAPTDAASMPPSPAAAELTAEPAPAQTASEGQGDAVQRKPPDPSAEQARAGEPMPRAYAGSDLFVPPGPRPPYDRRSTHSDKDESLPFGGLLLDAGVPDGLMLAGVVRPAWWVRLHAGVGSNSFSPGIRGGAALTPFGSGPSLAVEAGHYFEGDANGLVQSFAATRSDASAMLQRIGYDFANAHLGLEFGQERVLFFVHGGVTYLRTIVHDVNSALADDSATAESTTITVTKDPTVVAVAPSAKVGLIAYFL